MKNSTIKIFTTLLFIILTNLTIAQVAINQDNSNPDASAILDVKSTDKGILIPRMTTAQRTAISSPAKGLLVFDNNLNSFYYYDGTNWAALASTATAFEYDNANKIVTPNAANSDVANDDFVFGSPQLGDANNSDHDSRFFFDKSKGAFRAGDVKNDNWDDLNVGNFSVAFGKDTKAFGKGAFAAGRNSVAAGDYSFAAGDGVQANQNFSLAIGNNAISNAIGAVAIGDNALTDGLYSTAIGYQATTSNTSIGAIALGYQANADGTGAIAFGYGNTANNTGAVAIGYNATANGLGSVAVGYNTTSYSAFETTAGLFATSYTPNNTTGFDAADRLFIIGNGTNDANRSDAFMILKNGNTFINGALTLNNAFTFPTADGTNGQVLVTDGSGSLSWSSVSGSNQTLSLSGNDLTLTNGGSVDLSGYVNTDNQDLTLTGNTLSLTNDGTPVDLSTIQFFEYDNANKIVKPNTSLGDMANDDFVFGSTQLNNISGSADDDKRFFFDKSKGAFRAGEGNNYRWDNGSIGNFSAAFGYNTQAGHYAFATGLNTQATGQYSFAVGRSNGASGEHSFVAGGDNTANNLYSFALGRNNTASGEYSFVVGRGNSSLSFGETTLGLFATTYTPNSSFAYNANDRLFTIGNGTDVNNRSDAFMILKNGNTFINGALTIDNAYTLPTIDGINGQVLKTNGSGTLSWTTLTDSDNQDLTLSGNSLSLTNDASPVDLSGYLDNTDAQALSLSGNDLTLTNGGSVSLNSYLDNTDNQDLTLSGNSLSLTNDASPVDLSAYLDNTDNQNLSLSGNLLTISGGNTINISSINTNTNIFNTNGSINSNERVLTFSNTGATQHFTLKRSLNTDGNGFAFQNSASFYTSFILVPGDGDGNDGGLDFRTKNDNASLGSVENTMRLTNSGTVTLPEYGQGNVTGTLAKVLAVTSSGAIIEKNISDVSTFEYANNIFKPNTTISDIANDDFVFGATQLDNNAGTDDDNRFFFDKSKGAFRAGTGSNTNWDAANVGDYSAAFGSNTKANGSYSFAVGDNNTASAAYSAAIGGDNTASGFYSFAAGNSNTASGIYATVMGISNTSPSYGEVTFGHYATTYTPNSANSINSNDRLFTIGNGTNGSNRSNALVVLKNGRIGIGENSPNAQLHVKDNFAQSGQYAAIIENDNGGAYANGLLIKAGENTQSVNNRFISFTRPDGSEIGSCRQIGNSTMQFSTTSDRRLKTNIQPTAYGLSDLMKIEVRDYNYKGEEGITRTGFIAQQLFEHYPEPVSKGGEDAKTDPWMVDYGQVTPLLVKAVQEQQQQINDLKAENTALKAQVAKINELEAMLLEMKAQLNEQKADASNALTIGHF